MSEATREINTRELRTRGPVYTPGTDGYDDERAGFQRFTAHRPAVIVAATGAEDVRAAVGFAAARRTPVAVQASGHGLSTPVEGGVLISTRRMSGTRVDPQARTAWVEAGATWGNVIDATAPHGLAPLSGSFPGVGAVSYTLGGGVGLLARRFGFAADHVRRIDLVTADGQPRHVTADTDPDLFWALRGGGGNFGVVTGMEIDLMPVARIYGGALSFDVEQVPEALDGWRRWTETVPEEMTSGVTLLSAALCGRPIAQIQISYLGSAREGQQLIEPLRALGPRLDDTLRELPYSESGAVFDEPDQPHAYRSTNLLLSDLAPGALAGLRELAAKSTPAPSTSAPSTSAPSTSTPCVVGLRHLGGALARPPQPPSAVGHREAAYSLTVLSPVQPGEEDAVRAVHREALGPASEHAIGRSLNFSYGPLTGEQVRAGFAPDDYRRLIELKGRYDPEALIHCNHAIPSPAHQVSHQV